MKFFFSLLTFSLFCFSCTNGKREKLPDMAKLPELKANEQVATFAEGCFWHSEIVYESLVGVNEVLSGYAGGTTENPFYELVSEGETGHAECVQVYYDSTLISFKELVQAFFISHDATSLNRQGLDEGTEYRSIAFYRNTNEKQIITQTRDSLQTGMPRKIVTEIKPLEKFYPAEKFHQDYARKYPENNYVAYVCIPAFYDFRYKYKGRFKVDSTDKSQ